MATVSPVISPVAPVALAVVVSPALLEPHRFSVRERTQTAVRLLQAAIARECCHNVTGRLTALTLGPTSGEMRLGPTGARWAYTEHALKQALTKACGALVHGTQPHRQETPNLIANAMLWASHGVRSLIWGEALAAGPLKLKTKPRQFRIGTDIHGPHATGRTYVRAVVSEGHANESGDDVAFLAALEAFVLSLDAQFRDGQMRATRDPAGDTTGFIDSAQELSGNARVVLGFRNNEVGSGSASVSMSISFTYVLDGEERRAVVSIPGGRMTEREIHKGGSVGRMFESYGETVLMALNWAPGAMERLRNNVVPADGLLDMLEAMTKRITDENERFERVVEINEFREKLAAVNPVTGRSVAPSGSALNLALTCAHFGFERFAADVLETVCGPADSRH